MVMMVLQQSFSRFGTLLLYSWEVRLPRLWHNKHDMRTSNSSLSNFEAGLNYKDVDETPLS
jgi:hypothetical protein